MSLLDELASSTEIYPDAALRSVFICFQTTKLVHHSFIRQGFCGTLSVCSPIAQRDARECRMIYLSFAFYACSTRDFKRVLLEYT